MSFSRPYRFQHACYHRRKHLTVQKRIVHNNWAPQPKGVGMSFLIDDNECVGYLERIRFVMVSTTSVLEK